jgi:hypothetical protein
MKIGNSLWPIRTLEKDVNLIPQLVDDVCIHLQQPTSGLYLNKKTILDSVNPK